MRARSAVLAGLAVTTGCNAILDNGDYELAPWRDTLCSELGLPETTISGTVFAPNATLPLRDALVYVPNGPVAAIPDGVGPPMCASNVPANHIYSDNAGAFVVSGVTPGNHVPLVIQIGKWRRQIEIPVVTRCTDTRLDAEQTRLPRNAAEGGLPRIAVATGSADVLECIVHDLGIEDSEVTPSTGSGRVHLYNMNGTADTVLHGPLTLAANLYNADAMNRYDMIMMACEGEATATTNTAQLFYDWTLRGGWFFPHHFESEYLDLGPPAWQSIADFVPATVTPAAGEGTLDPATPAGAVFAQWMTNVGATSAPGIVPIANVRQSCVAADAAVTERLMFLDPARNAGLSGTQLFTWDGGNGGRVVFSDMHAGVAATFKPYPNDCPAQPMSPQAKAIAYGLFDLHTCITP